MKLLQLTIPGEPMGKARPKVTRFGTYTPKKTVNYETLIQELFITKYPKSICFPIDPLRMKISAYFTIPKSASKRSKVAMLAGEIRPTKKPDGDNIIKIVSDALNRLAYHDDSQIVEVACKKLYAATPRVEIQIEKVG